MDTPAPSSVLDGIPLFDSFSLDERAAVARRGRVVAVPGGTVLVREGDAGDALYVLLDGVVRVLRRDPAGNPVEVARRGVGDCFGEMALIDGGPRSATVVADTPLRLFVLERAPFQELVAPSPALLAKLLRELSRKVRDASDRLAREDLDGRMRTAEAELARHRGIVQAVTGLAHELNTPLGICVTTASHLEALAETAAAGPAGALMEPARLLRANLARAVTLVEAFTAIAAGSGNEPVETMDLADAAAHAAALFAMDHPEARLSVAVTGPGPCPWRGPRLPLERALFELFANAAAHAYPGAPGGAVAVAVAAAVLDGRPAWSLAVRDAGPGVAPEVGGRLFDAFFTTARNRGHKGLGLTIVYNAVTGPLAGRVALDGAPGRGTTVTLTLPQSVEPGRAPPTGAAAR